MESTSVKEKEILTKKGTIRRHSLKRGENWYCRKCGRSISFYRPKDSLRFNRGIKAFHEGLQLPNYYPLKEEIGSYRMRANVRTKLEENCRLKSIIKGEGEK